MNTSVGLYLRISQDSEKTGAGVERQRTQCIELIESEGWELVDTYEDNDISATNGSTRPAWERLLSDVRRGRITRIVAWARDRLSRSTIDTGILEREAKRHGVLVTIHPGTTYDLTEPADLLNFQVLGAVGGFESNQKNKRQKARYDKDFEEGLPFQRRRAFGWDINETKVGLRGQNPYDLTLVNKDEAEAIRWAFQQVIDGNDNVRSIANHWNSLGLLTTGGKPWTVNGVKGLLRNPYYAGIQCKIDPEKSTTTWLTFPDIKTQWEPIVSRETWLEVQGLLDRKTEQFHRGTRTPKKTWLTGIVNCGVEGCTRYLHRNGVTMECSGDWHFNKINLDMLDSIESYVIRTIAWEGKRLRLNDPTAARFDELRARLVELQDELEAVKGIKRVSIRVTETNRITDEMDTVNDELTGLNASRSMASVIADLANPVTNRVVSWSVGADNTAMVREAWERLDITQKSKIAKSLGVYVVVKRAPGLMGAKRLSIYPRDPLTGEVSRYTTNEDAMEDTL